MSAQPPTPRSPAASLLWCMLLALIAGFSLSQAYRTMAGILSVPLMAHFQLTPRQMGLVAATFHYAFGCMQLLMGVGIDMFGIRRTILWAFPLTLAGAVLCALAPTPTWLITGQALIGIGCAPAFLVCTVFIARHFPPQQFAATSGLALGLGGLGLIFTGSPLAWLVEQHNWSSGFWIMACLSLLAWLLIYLLVHEPDANPTSTEAGAEHSIWQALTGYGTLLRMRHTAGILALVFVGYSSFIALRGLWLAPYLGERFGQNLVFSGHVALTLSVIALFAPSLFGRLDPGHNQRRRRWLMRVPWISATLFVVLASTHNLYAAIAAIWGIAIMSGYTVWQYADVRASYPSHMTGRAMALFTMSMFLGVAIVQTLTGAAASWALERGLDPYQTVFFCTASLLALGCSAYIALPKPNESPPNKPSP